MKLGKNYTCTVCGAINNFPVFAVNGKDYCYQHDPIGKTERMRLQGYTEEEIKEEKQPRKKGSLHS